ncbi:hypothetical protein [Calidifontibacter terrae]
MDRTDGLINHLEALPGVKRKGTAARPAWYLHNRLVARAEEADRWVIRCTFALREELLDAYPDTFGVRPQFEAHEKIEAYPDVGVLAAIERALDAAWEMQGGRG